MSEAAVAVPPPQVRTAGIALRRGIVLVLMTLIVPGSAQLAHGSRRLGRIAIRVWGAILLLGLVALVLFFANRTLILTLLGFAANPIVIQVIGWLVVALGVGWGFLALDAWRIANPRTMTGRGRAVSGVLALVIALGLVWGSWNGRVIFASSADLISTVMEGGGETETIDGRYNILLLGGDSSAARNGVRVDSITVASIDAKTGRTILFSLPRNLQRAPFPKDSPLYEKYPDGYWCKSQECLLNAIYTEATNNNNKKLFKGVKNPGIVATKGAVEETLGLKINYWAIVDMDGFEALIDAVGGITLDIGKKVPMGSVNGKKGVFDWIEAGKNVHLDGYHALWFARSREYSSDYERMARQKCVMNAMLKQLDPATVLTSFQEIAAAGKNVVKTDLPTDQIGAMLELAPKIQKIPMTSVSFVPPLIKPANPDFAKIRQIVADEIAAAEAADEAAEKATASAEPEPEPTPSASATPKPKSNAQKLDSICKVS
ncbi:MAG: LCP family protein [Propionibacteriaceae bacterium]|jgi:LCP family protein required for cell wall assembly|nr:LCP family protein [Propionibacteriaceae bacterium]